MRVCEDYLHTLNVKFRVPQSLFSFSRRYDFYVQPRDTSKKKRGPSLRELEGWLFAGSDRIPVETKLVVRERVLELEKVGEAKRIYRDGRDGSPAVPESRPVGPECDECKGNEKRKCKKCG